MSIERQHASPSHQTNNQMINLINVASASIKGLAAGALLSTVLLIPTPQVKADTLYEDSYGSVTGGSSYNQGRYVDATRFGEGRFGGGVIEDRNTGKIYDCTTQGQCY